MDVLFEVSSNRATKPLSTWSVLFSNRATTVHVVAVLRGLQYSGHNNPIHVVPVPRRRRVVTYRSNKMLMLTHHKEERSANKGKTQNVGRGALHCLVPVAGAAVASQLFLLVSLINLLFGHQEKCCSLFCLATPCTLRDRKPFEGQRGGTAIGLIVWIWDHLVTWSLDCNF